MKLLPLSELVIDEERVRRFFDKARLDELATSITNNGLLHPIVVRHNEKLETVLIAGERRFNAMRLLHNRGTPFRVVNSNGYTPVPPQHIPVNYVSDLDASAILEAEIEENVCRVDVSWQERIEAEAKLHTLRVKQNPTHTLKDTAREIYGDDVPSGAASELKRDLLIHELRDNPVFKGAKTLDDARKRLAHHRKELFLASVGDILAQTVDPSEHVVFENKEGCAAMTTLGLSGTEVDVFCFDPPYGIAADTFRNFNSLAKHTYSDEEQEAKRLTERFLSAIEVCRAKEAHIYIFCDINAFYGWLAPLVESFDWKVWPRPLIWAKRQHAGAPDYDAGPARQYEAILFATKGGRKVARVGGDVLTHAAVRDKLHSAQKPSSLLTDMLSRVCSVGDIICDPCAGSGSIVLAAKELGLQCFAYEIDEETYKKALVNINVGDSLT